MRHNSEDVPEIMKVKKMSDAEEADADIAAMDDVEERQKRAIARAQKGNGKETEDDNENDGSLAEKPKQTSSSSSSEETKPIAGFEKEEEPEKSDESEKMSPQQLAVKNTLDKIQAKKLHDNPDLAR